ncbi:MAG: hypothetical protein JKY24_04760 [Pseudomonadales bacterium]|nr:hypothetical protein [Pseudomonadales bacterium]
MSARFNTVFLCLVATYATLFSITATSKSIFEFGDWDHEMGFEWRTFKEKGFQDQSKNSLSIYYQPELYWDNSDSDSFILKPFIRWDQTDSNRGHFDLRDAYWTHVGSWWETKIGVTSVYWGKTEFTQLVNIVNQKDLIEGVRGSPGLGQPMVNATFLFDEGTLDIFLLAGFREATFAGENGRLRTPLLVDGGKPQFDDQAVRGLDFAIRWEQSIGDYWEIAINQYSGLSRDPTLVFNFDILGDPAFLPYYEQIDQTGFEAEFIYEGVIWKFEGVAVSGQSGGAWKAFSTGLEYTFGDVFDSGQDITAIFEYVNDSRASIAPHFLERDYTIGFRWMANDELDTTGLVGMLYDPDTHEKLVSMEASRRLGPDWRLSLSATVVLEKGEPIIDDNITDAFNSLLANGPLNLDLSDLSDEAKSAFADLILNPNDLIQLFTGGSEAQARALETLQILQIIASGDTKLGVLDNDDFVQLELIYYF